MNWNKLTTYIIWATIIALIAYDIVVILVSGKQDSISWIIIEHSYENPVAPFGAGFLCGHLFWRMKKPGGNE
jgi:hypothetical protein